jgi:hypothetical protein
MSGGNSARDLFSVQPIRKEKKMRYLTLVLAALLCASPVGADLLVVDIDPPNSDSNPQRLSNSGQDTETAWLQGLLGGAPVSFISKDEDSNPLDEVPSNWTYAILKFGVGAPPSPDHWAVYDDNNNDILEIGGLGLPTQGLSHVTYFSTTPATPVPEPATMLLLGAGLIGLAGFGRKKLI